MNHENRGRRQNRYGSPLLDYWYRHGDPVSSVKEYLQLDGMGSKVDDPDVDPPDIPEELRDDLEIIYPEEENGMPEHGIDDGTEEGLEGDIPEGEGSGS